MEFGTGIDIMISKELDVLHCKISRCAIRQGFQIQKTASCSFLLPFPAVVVTVKNNPFVAGYDAFQQIMEILFKIFRLFQKIRILPEGLRHRCIQHNIRP